MSTETPICPICPICYQTIESDDTCTLPCNHSYHTECMRQNLAASRLKVCPYCRESYTSQPSSLETPSISAGDRVMARYKIGGKTVSQAGEVSRVMPNTVNVILDDGMSRRIRRYDAIKLTA